MPARSASSLISSALTHLRSHVHSVPDHCNSSTCYCVPCFTIYIVHCVLCWTVHCRQTAHCKLIILSICELVNLSTLSRPAASAFIGDSLRESIRVRVCLCPFCDLLPSDCSVSLSVSTVFLFPRLFSFILFFLF